MDKDRQFYPDICRQPNINLIQILHGEKVVRRR